MIIGLAGPAYAGKSEIAKAIREVVGKKIVIRAFGTSLKEMATKFGWDGKKDEKGRKFLQTLGTEIGRAYNPDFWVEEWRRKVGEASGAIKDAIADDVRFPNEVDCIHNFRGIVVCVTAKESIRKARALAKGEVLPPKHSSEEWEKLEVDITIENNGDVDSKILAEKILSFYKEQKKK